MLEKYRWNFILFHLLLHIFIQFDHACVHGHVYMLKCFKVMCIAEFQFCCYFTAGKTLYNCIASIPIHCPIVSYLSILQQFVHFIIYRKEEADFKDEAKQWVPVLIHMYFIHLACLVNCTIYSRKVWQIWGIVCDLPN